MKYKKCVGISIDAEKASDKTRRPFMVKMLNKLGPEGMFLNTLKTKFDNPTSYLMVKS